MDGPDSRREARIGLDIGQERNRQLLTQLFGESNVFDISGSVPEETDLCLVDESAIERSPERFAAWHASQAPVFAPVVLLVESDASRHWERFEGSLSRYVDSILEIPMPRSELSARIDNLLEMRALSRGLREEQQLTAQIFESSPLGKLLLDADGTVLRANERAAEILGIDRDALVGDTYGTADWSAVDADGDVIPPAELPFQQVLESGQHVYDYEHIVERPGREDCWVSVNMAPIQQESGDIEYVVTVFDDITIRRDQAEKLEQQVALFEQTQEIADVGAWEYDPLDEELYCTKKTYDIYDYPTEQSLTPEDAFDAYHPADREVVQAAFERAIEAGEPFDIEARLLDCENTLHWVRNRGEPRLEDGKVVHVRGTLQDITERKQRELTLAQMTNAVDNAPIGITVTDPSQPDNPMVYVNDGFVELTGYSREESLGRNCRFLQGENTDPATVARIRRAIDAGRPVSVDLRNYRADGPMFWNHLEIAPIRDENGEVTNYIGFQQDVSDRVERRQQLDILDRYLRHNLRNRMNVVQGMAETIAHREQSVSESADMIIQASSKLLSTMDKERAVTEMLKSDPEVVRTDLTGTLEAAVERFRTESPEATVTLSAPAELRVQATTELSLAIEELLQNAIEHSGSEYPRVEVSVAAENEEVTVQVSDDGPGIPETEIETLSKPELTSPVNHGQGLGLWMVSLVVRRCGGRIEFPESEEESGATVRVVLKKAPAERGPPESL